MSNTVSEILLRFDNFNDSVLEDISISYARGPRPDIQIVLNCQDDLDPQTTRRQCFLNFHDVEEFKLEQCLKTSSIVVSFGIAVIVEAGLTYVDFACDGFLDRTIQEVRAGGFYIGARKVDFTFP